MKKVIQIYLNDVWAGTGTIDENNYINDCGAILGINQEESDKTYECITDAIDDGDEWISRPDGLYWWEIGDLVPYENWSPAGI